MSSRQKSPPRRPKYLQQKLLNSQNERKRQPGNQPFQYELLEPRQLLAVIQGTDGTDRQSLDSRLSDLIMPGTASANQTDSSLLSGVLSQSNLIGNGEFDDLVPTRSYQNNWQFVRSSASLAMSHDVKGNPNFVVNLIGSETGAAIVQDVRTDAGSKYWLTFDVRAQGELGNDDNKIGLFWDGQFQRTFQAIDAWQQMAIQLNANHAGSTRLRFNGPRNSNESFVVALDNVRLVQVLSDDAGNGRLENNISESGIVDWNSNRDTQPSNIKISEGFNSTGGKNVLQLNSSYSLVDRIWHDVEVEAGQQDPGSRGSDPVFDFQQ